MDIYIALFGTTISFLLTGNLFFIKKIIENIERTSFLALETKSNLALLKTDVNAIGGLLRELKLEIKDLRRIDIDVAVMKAQMAHRQIVMESTNDKTLGS